MANARAAVENITGLDSSLHWPARCNTVLPSVQKPVQAFENYVCAQR